jgi:hypothetical protein
MSAERESRSRRRLSRHERRQLSRARQAEDAASPLPASDAASAASVSVAVDEDAPDVPAFEDEATAIARWQQEARLERALKDRLVQHAVH